jgi:hypothetical protein
VLDYDLVEVAPAPGFSGLDGADGRVLGRVEVLGRVLVGRGVATADVAADETLAQVNPPGAYLVTVLAAFGMTGGDAGDVLEVVEVRTGHMRAPGVKITLRDG